MTMRGPPATSPTERIRRPGLVMQLGWTGPRSGLAASLQGLEPVTFHPSHLGTTCGAAV